jgi:hypothetical protein
MTMNSWMKSPLNLNFMELEAYIWQVWDPDFKIKTLTTMSVKIVFFWDDTMQLTRLVWEFQMNVQQLHPIFLLLLIKLHGITLHEALISYIFHFIFISLWAQFLFILQKNNLDCYRTRKPSSVTNFY